MNRCHVIGLGFIAYTYNPMPYTVDSTTGQAYARQHSYSYDARCKVTKEYIFANH
ncbi:hypothetical protein NGH74_13855 [Staphylococcus pseudoxylosus]|uniref:hypothetical protein n=1 Tax=Staphylococcus pseudoxylosus TaxID=2282419 RepID=UPI002DBDEF4C|nr:hypothetical protein [Staphylococcus pseudoxylosus]MEB8088245.1 hypothetical protein [Staphylococcus pseudoxylosus]